LNEISNKKLKEELNLMLGFNNELNHHKDGLTEESVLKGIPSSPGIIMGKAFILEPETFVIPSERISDKEVDSEIEKFEHALLEMFNEYKEILQKVKEESSSVYSIIESNLMMVSDKFFAESIKKRIRDGNSVESSVIQEFDERKQFFINSKDKILRERAIELDQIKERFFAVLRKKTLHHSIAQNSIIIAQFITPTDLVSFRDAGILGIITEVGGIASHSSILARSFGIPAVIGVKNAIKLIKQGSDLILDGYSGIIITNPPDKSIDNYIERKNKEDVHRQSLGNLVKLPSKTIDGFDIRLLSNIDFVEDIETSLMVGAEGVGLVRTEYLIFALKYVPDEEEQFGFYKELSDRIYPHPVTIRVFDLGSDKFNQGMLRHEDNPALGFRGIRFLLSSIELFETQIRAILRASAHKNIRLMLPMITTLREIRQSIAIIEECKQNLRNQNIDFDEKIPIGIMIETPAAALVADTLAEHVDFFSIGTNDLTQYTVAADRTNELISDVFDSFHPAVLKLIKMSIDAAKTHNIPVGICGELAGHAAATTLLVGMGVDELSVTPAILLELKNRIREINFEDSKKIVKEVLKSTTIKHIKEILGT
jgi:phosphoenolpyruvate-protein phosphotransferase (PTS system enzyme I)